MTSKVNNKTFEKYLEERFGKEQFERINLSPILTNKSELKRTEKILNQLQQDYFKEITKERLEIGNKL